MNLRRCILPLLIAGVPITVVAHSAGSDRSSADSISTKSSVNSIPATPSADGIPVEWTLIGTDDSTGLHTAGKASEESRSVSRQRATTMGRVAQPDSVATLHEVNVTAVKQMEVLRNAPEAATLITSTELERVNAVSIKGISDIVPNFFMPDYGSRITSSIYVRGIGARMDQPSVGLNVDNVPYLNKDAYDFDVADIVSVEMLRGPQSTLYGRNTMAGVINVTTLSPFRYQGWRLSGEYSARNKGKGSIGWYHLFSPTVGFSLTGAYTGAAGEFTNEYNGKKLDWEHNANLRSKLHWRINSDWTLQNTLSTGWLHQGGYPYENVESGKISFNDTCFYKRFTFTDGVTLRRRGEKFNITSITSVQHINDNMTLDQDFLPAEYFTLTQKKQEWDFTEDVVVRNAKMQRYNWLGGVFMFYKHMNMQAPVTFKDVGIRELIENHRNNANSKRPIEWDTRSFPLESYFTNPTVGVALYHESDYRLGQWTFNAGLRLDFENSTLHYNSVCHTGYTIYRLEEDNKKEFHRHVDIDIDEQGTLSRHFLTLLPKVAVTYNLEDEKGNIYAKISKGYKAGGFNTQMFSEVLQQRLMNIMGIGTQYNINKIVGYKPEQSWNYEIGSHLNIFSNKLSLDLAAFYIDCRDQQMTTFPAGTTTGRIMTNAGRTRSFGGEVSLSAELPGNISLTCNYGYTNARFIKFFDGITDYSGKYLPYAPKNTLFLQGVWKCPLNQGKSGMISLDVNMRGTGSIYWNEANDLKQPFYALLGGGITYAYSNLTLQLWGTNLTSTRYYTFYFLSMGNEFLQRGRGADVGLTVRYNF